MTMLKVVLLAFKQIALQESGVLCFSRTVNRDRAKAVTLSANLA